MNDRTLFIAYGNPDRQDDGVAWKVLQRLSEIFEYPVADWNTDFYELLGHNPDFFFTLQLTPELHEVLIQYDRVCFIDAHLGDEFDDIELRVVEPNYEPSTLSHHMTPQFMLDIIRANHGRFPAAVLLTIRGYEFQFVQGLSERTSDLAEKAIRQAVDWYHSS